uniref:Uncharacterized protein n=1 Tax=Daphnia galeata TaxID=27404 RepID=A0A8J2RLJ2_9CRUS|nr:unnamed protein product [Daphnia galeata]
MLSILKFYSFISCCIYFRFFLIVIPGLSLIGIVMSEAASTSLSHGKAKIDAMSICMNNMPSSYAMPIFHLQGIPVSFLR